MSQEQTVQFERATIVGPGLLGASLGMTLREKNIAKEIFVHLRDEKKIEDCKNSGWCDHAETSLEKAVEKSDLVVVCTPVDAILVQLRLVSQWASPGALVTDVGSLKEEICLVADKVFGESQCTFVGSHPMSGSEKEGILYASPDLFEGKKCILTPTDRTDPRTLAEIKGMWKRMGMTVSEMNARNHDEMVSWISHLPHLTACALINTIGSNAGEGINMCGNGLKDTTRIASGNPEMWKQILCGNKQNLIKSVEELINHLEVIKKKLEAVEQDHVLEILKLAKNNRDQLSD